MRKTVLTAILAILVISGCSVSIRKTSWPPQGTYSTWYKPSYIYSADEAISVLKALTAGASINGRSISSVDADKFTLRMSQRWQETQESTEYVPSFGGFFLGWNYVPVYSGTYQTNSTTLNKEQNIAVNFRDISDISISGRVLYVSSSAVAVIVCGSQAEAQKYADAFYSMMKENGVKLGASYGFSFSGMSAGQEEDINKKGVVTDTVFSGGPADKAGLQARDIIYEANGKAVTTPQALADALVAAGPAKAAELKVIHWEKPDDDPYTVKWEKRSITLRPVER